MVAIKICLLLSSVLFAYGANIGFSSKPQLDGRIVGGFPIEISQVPWQVSLQTRGSHLCGGSIISEHFILTASHCMSFVENAENILVRVGSNEHATGGVLHKVKRIIEHNETTGISMDYDYALLELKESIEFNDQARPIALPEAEDVVSDNTTCLVTGWGKTQSPSESREKLRGVEIPIVNQEKCKKAFENIGEITDRMICAGFDEGGKDSCNGDSGGPLVAFDDSNKNAVLVGIVSWGKSLLKGPCAEPNYPGVYARVQVVRNWIFENTGI